MGFGVSCGRGVGRVQDVEKIMTEQQVQDFAPSRARLLRGVIASVLILVVGVLAFRVMSRMRKRPQKKDTLKKVSLRVVAQEVRYKAQLLRLKGFGTAEPDRKLEIVSQVTGKVVFVVRPAFKVGVRVRRGQTLLVVDRSDYTIEHKRLKATIASLKKQIKIAERAYQLSRKNLGRSKRLVKRSALDPGTYEQAEQGVLDRGQRLESLRQALQVNQIQLRRARLNLNRTTIRAPFHARISQGNISRGTFVAAGRLVGAIESVDAVEIPVAFSLEALHKMARKDGAPIKLNEIPAYLAKLPPVTVTAGEQTWKGRVLRTASSLDVATRTLTLFVNVNLRQQKQVGNLLPGTFCGVRIPVRRMKRVIALPRRALYQGNVMYVAVEGKIAQRKVEVAYRDSERVYVTGGLREGDKVIVSKLADPVVGTPVFLSMAGGKG